MPLSPSTPRTQLHTRDIQIKGYERDDGLFDIEAQLTDTKTYGFDNEHRGFVEPGRPLHGMWVRLTVNDRMVIVAAEAVSDHGPYRSCGGGALSYANLVGLRIQAGFLREANARMRGPAGCTHLREMLQEIATTALQTMWPVRERRAEAARVAAGAAARAAGAAVPERDEADGSARLLDTCFAYASDGQVVQERWPHHYTGGDKAGGGKVADQLIATASSGD